jgi:predicted phosphoribosyltransferase
MIIFKDRKEAGKQLAEKLFLYLKRELKEFQQSDIVVVGLPRGGAIVALEVARKFGCHLEILVSKKIPHPGDGEYAIGAVTADSEIVLNPDIPENDGWQHYIEEQRQRLLHQTKEMEEAFYDQAGYIADIFENKIVIVVDDGVATGMTAIAALETARMRQAKMIVMAAPVMSPDSHHAITKFCHHVVASYVPSDFLAVGQYYRDFKPTEFEEVIDAMKESRHFAPPVDMSFLLQSPNKGLK